MYPDEIVGRRRALRATASRCYRAGHHGKIAEIEPGQGSSRLGESARLYADPRCLYRRFFQARCREGNDHPAPPKSTCGSEQEINGIIPERSRLTIALRLFDKVRGSREPPARDLWQTLNQLPNAHAKPSAVH